MIYLFVLVMLVFYVVFENLVLMVVVFIDDKFSFF